MTALDPPAADRARAVAMNVAVNAHERADIHHR